MRSARARLQGPPSRVKARLLAGVLCVMTALVSLLPATLDGVGASRADAAIGALSLEAGSGPSGLRGEVHRSITRTERSLERFLLSLFTVVVVWSWILVRAVVFLVVAAFASVVDRRLISLWRAGEHSVARYLGGGVRTFFGLAVDRRTPNSARSVLVVALAYWLLPFDLVADGWGGGYADDVLVAIMAARLFIRLCPDRLITRHAALAAPRLRG